MGGATLAAALAPTGRRVLILERGERLRTAPRRATPPPSSGAGISRPNETWRDAEGAPLQPRQLRLSSAAIPSSTARSCSATGPRISRPLRHIGRHDARAGRSAMTSWSRYYTPGRDSCTACAAMSRATRPNRRIRRPIPFRPCRTSPTSRRCAGPSRRRGCSPSRLPLGRGHRPLARAARRRPGTPFPAPRAPSPTPKAAGWPRR